MELPLRNLQHDGLYLPSVKEHSLEKIIRHNYYAAMFATGMKGSWLHRAYVGLYAGAGRAQLHRTGEIFETSAMSVLRLRDPFTKHVFVDADARCTTALEQRIRNLGSAADVTVLTGDANELVSEIGSALPRYSRGNGLVSLCFVDPFAADIRFATIRHLARFRMDFLLLLMLGRDLRANFRRYFGDTASTRIGDLIDCAEWRHEFNSGSERNIVRFVLRKFDQKMTSLGYQAAIPRDYHRVTVPGKNVMQYVLILYSRHEIGQQYWRATLTRNTPQISLDL